MILEEFIQATIVELNRFKKHWINHQVKFPQLYPSNLEEGDWYDQFLAFNDLVSDKSGDTVDDFGEWTEEDEKSWEDADEQYRDLD